ncbi:hypothetical protein GJ496_006020, partial [Pomphorhynchus laevis]
ELADQLGIKFMETSAKNSINVDTAFREMTKEIMSKISQDDIKHGRDGRTINPASQPISSSNSRCC